MPITVTCLGCDTQLTFPEEQAGILPLCPTCAAAVSGPRRKPVAIPADSTDRSSESVCREALTDDLAAEPADQPAHEELLELGPRWSQVERAFAWVHFGIAALTTGLVFRFFAALLNSFFGAPAAVPLTLLQYVMFAIAGFSILIGQLLCLRVPTGTHARPAAIICLVARLLAFGLSLYGAMYWWEVETDIRIEGSVRESMLLTSCAFVLGGWMASLLVEFSFLVLLKRVGRFLEDQAIVRHARLGNRILIGYLIASLLLSAVGIAWIYHSILGEIDAVKLQYPQVDPPPRTWLVSRISYILFSTKNTSPLVARAQLGIATIVAVFWIALGNQYWAALSAAKTAIGAGLARGEISRFGSLFPSLSKKEKA